jgi:CheY-like chemotaxis protein
LVLGDLHMPVMDGFAATQAIHTWEGEHGRPPTPIVALSASAMPEDLRHVLAAGCNAHAAKPVKKATLLQIFDRYASPPSESP